MSDDDNGITNSIEASYQGIDLKVDGADPEWVEEMFDDKLDELNELQEDLRSFHVEAGAGWLMAHGEADTPEEAYALWLDMWERMIEDVEELSDQEREQAGLTRQ